MAVLDYFICSSFYLTLLNLVCGTVCFALVGLSDAFSILIKFDVDWTYDCWIVCQLVVASVFSSLISNKNLKKRFSEFHFALPVTMQSLPFFSSLFCLKCWLRFMASAECKMQCRSPSERPPMREQSMPNRTVDVCAKTNTTKHGTKTA